MDSLTGLISRLDRKSQSLLRPIRSTFSLGIVSPTSTTRLTNRRGLSSIAFDAPFLALELASG